MNVQDFQYSVQATNWEVIFLTAKYAPPVLFARIPATPSRNDSIVGAPIQLKLCLTKVQM
jgi:hypothetical protein